MGLDSVELLMDIEETFGITVSDEEAVTAQTPRLLIDLVLSKIATTLEKGCASQRAFYLLRRALTEHAGAAREAVTPNAELRDLIATDRTRQVWPVLEQAVQAPVWPALLRPPALVAALYALGCAVFVSVLLLMAPTGIPRAAFKAYFATLIFATLAIVATERWRTRLPDKLRKIRDLIPYIGTSDHIAWTPEKVSLTVKMLVVEQLGISEDDYHDDAHFVKDLGMD